MYLLRVTLVLLRDGDSDLIKPWFVAFLPQLYLACQSLRLSIRPTRFVRALTPFCAIVNVFLFALFWVVYLFGVYTVNHAATVEEVMLGEGFKVLALYGFGPGMLFAGTYIAALF